MKYTTAVNNNKLGGPSEIPGTWAELERILDESMEDYGSGKGIPIEEFNAHSAARRRELSAKIAVAEKERVLV